MSRGLEQRQQLRAAVAAANRDERRDRRVAPGVVDRASAMLGRARHEPRPRRRRRVGRPPRSPSRRSSATPACRSAVLKRAGRRHERDAIAGRAAGAGESQKRRHLGGHGLMLLAAEDPAPAPLVARRVAGRPRAGTAAWPALSRRIASSAASRGISPALDGLDQRLERAPAGRRRRCRSARPSHPALIASTAASGTA